MMESDAVRVPTAPGQIGLRPEPASSLGHTATVPSRGFTPGPWTVCQHLKSVECDQACSCGYRGVIYGPEHDVAFAVCQPGHEPAPKGEEGSEPARYPREVEIANAHLIAAAPDLLDALENLVIGIGMGWDLDGIVEASNAALAKARGQ